MFSFIVSFIQHISKKQNTNSIQLVLDNSLENRWTDIARAASILQFSLVFITSAFPEENMAENFFFYLKVSYSTIKFLDSINTASNTKMEMISKILISMSNVCRSEYSAVKKFICLVSFDLWQRLIFIKREIQCILKR